MKVTTNNKTFNILFSCDEKDFYKVKVFDLQNNEIGGISFKLKINDRLTWLYKIEVCQDYQNNGIGKILLEFLEFVSLQRRIYFVEGKFFPKNQNAKFFYLKNGYNIEKDGYETFVYKSLDYNNEKKKNKFLKSFLQNEKKFCENSLIPYDKLI